MSRIGDEERLGNYTKDKNVEELIDELINMVRKKGRKGVARVLYGRTVAYILLLLLQLVLLYLSVLRYHYSSIFFGSSTFISLVVVLCILNEEINPTYKLAWIIPVVALPVVGTFTYLWIRFQPAPIFMRRNQRKIDGELHEFLERDGRILAELDALEKCGDGRVRDLKGTSNYLYNTMRFPIYRNEGVDYFSLGDHAFRRILMELGKAQKYIFIEYFIIEPGVMWDAILEILKVKAEQGVEVRVMYDGTCNFKLLPNSYPKTLEQMGIQCRIFSPITPLLSVHQNNRDHRKILVIDGEVAFTGGVNFADEYINEIDRFGHWKDTAVMVRGQAVRTFTALFLEMWNLREKNNSEILEKYLREAGVKEDISNAGGNGTSIDKFVDNGDKNNSIANDHDGREIEQLEHTVRPVTGYVIPYGDTPLDKENTGEQVYLDVINQANHYVYIMTPYLILDHEMLSALKTAAKRGVDVRIIMPHRPDKRYAFALARSYYPELLGAGVKMYEYIPGFVHAKVCLSDDCKATVGTVNLDYRSLYLNFECGLYMYGTENLVDIYQDFQGTLNKCKEITLEKYKKINVLKRAVGRILRLFAPLL